MPDTIAVAIASANDKLSLGWGLPPPDTDAQGLANEVRYIHMYSNVKMNIIIGVIIGQFFQKICCCVAVSCVAGTSHRCSGSGPATGRSLSLCGVLHSLLPEEGSLWGQVKNLPQEAPQYQVFCLHRLLSTHKHHNSVSIYSPCHFLNKVFTLS